MTSYTFLLICLCFRIILRFFIINRAYFRFFFHELLATFSRAQCIDMAFLHHTLDTIFLKSSPKRELKGNKKFPFSNYHMKQQLKSAYGAISTEDYWLCSIFSCTRWIDGHPLRRSRIRHEIHFYFK